jgi:hypothetical protein
MDRRINILVSVIPLGAALLFAGLMLYFAAISTQPARDHYRSKRLTESVQKVAQLRLTPEGMRYDKPASESAPAKQKNWFAKYELNLPLTALPLMFLGFYLARMIFSRLPDRNPFRVSDLMRRSLLVMVCSFILSPAFLMLYVWSLRIGLIG